MFKLLLILFVFVAAFHVTSTQAQCDPVCSWVCPGQGCDLAGVGVTNADLCSPVCEEPSCDYVCYNSSNPQQELPCTGISPPLPDCLINTTLCAVNATEDFCPTTDCPECDIECESVTCPQGLICEVECAATNCTYDCRKPTSTECPQPVCTELVCTEACPSETPPPSAAFSITYGSSGSTLFFTVVVAVASIALTGSV